MISCLLLVFMQKIIFTVKKNPRKMLQAEQLLFLAQVSTKSLDGPRPHWEGRKRGEDEGRKKGNGEKGGRGGQERAPIEIIPPNQNPKYASDSR